MTIFGDFRRILKKSKFPYVYELKCDGINAKFNINSTVEEFRIISWGGEELYTKNIINSLDKKDTFYDIGSSVGLVSILAAHKLTEGFVYSFEPDPDIIVRIKANYLLNDVNDYRIIKKAISDKKSILELYTSGADNNSPSLKPTFKSACKIKVNIDSVDNMIRRKIIAYPDVMKIDVEGAEMNVIKGCKKLFTSEKRPRLIYIEIHPIFIKQYGYNKFMVKHFLLEHGYHLIEEYEIHNQLLCTFGSK